MKRLEARLKARLIHWLGVATKSDLAVETTRGFEAHSRLRESIRALDGSLDFLEQTVNTLSNQVRMMALSHAKDDIEAMKANDTPKSA